MILKKALFSGFGLLMICALASCSSGITQVKKLIHNTSIIEMKIKASEDLNPNRKDRPSPVVIYLYELSDGAPFDEADFFSIYEQEAATIGSVLLGKMELELSPGESREIKRVLKAETRHLGIVAGFRDIDNAKWRASMAMPEYSKIELKLNLDRLSISLTED
ncbi:MAG: type VI secretion system lipoprotein TssJ [Gammaproteobacteria bacterium]|nr:type VI secretion system lipoprotein TssJ [Gammaproteobacteria bacterium]